MDDVYRARYFRDALVLVRAFFVSLESVSLSSMAAAAAFLLFLLALVAVAEVGVAVPSLLPPPANEADTGVGV